MSDQQFQEASELYRTVKPQLQSLQDQLKQLRKEESKAKRVFKKYMKRNQLTEMNVAGVNFVIENKERVQCNLDLVEEHFNPAEVENFVKENTVVKEVFTCA